MNLAQHLELNRLMFELIETQAKIAYYYGRDWGPRKLYRRIEELETEIQKLTVQAHSRTRRAGGKPS